MSGPVPSLDNLDVNNSLIFAVREGRLERAKELINYFGLSYSRAWSGGYVLLRDAVKNKHTAVAKLLLTSGSKVTRKNKKLSNTPLHFAVINGDMEIVKMILDKGGNINAKNKHGQTPLHNAIRIDKKMEIIELLLKHRADVNAIDKDGTSLLHVAVKIGCLQIVDHLLKYGAYVNCMCTSRWKKGYAPLHFAVEKGSKEVITLLLSRGANVDVKGEDGITPLHIAAKNGYIHIAEDLLKHGACTHSFTLKEGYTPMHFASKLGNEEAVKLFLNKGADINASTNGNLTPLHIATKTGHGLVVKLLLQRGAKVDNQDKDGKTTLHLAVEEGYLTIVEDVLRYCPDINDQSNRSSLKIAVHGYEEEYKKIVEALLEYGFIVNPEEANNPQLLHAAVEKGYLKIIEDLLKYGADVNTLCNSTFKGFTPLHSAANNKQEEVAKLLISYEADINAQDKAGKTPIFYAIQNADLKITMLLLTNRANIKDCPDLLNIAVKKECIEIVEALLQHNADINASDEYGRTALHFTALSESEDFFGFGFRTNKDPDTNIKGEIAKLLLSKGANVDAQTKNGVTALHTATQKGYVKVVEALFKYNANVNCGVKSDITPLHFSAQRGNDEISMMLFNKGANVNAKQKDGITALHIATQNGHKEVVKVLLEWGAKVDSKIKSDVTPLHLGAEKGCQEIIETILKFGANIDSTDEYGRTALHIASQEGHVEVVVTLLENGSDINITSKNNCTPLDHAVAGRWPFYSQAKNYSSDGYYDPDRGVCSCEVALKRHIVKMKTANLYVCEKNLLSMSSSGEISGFQDECEEEIASMKSEKINNLNISFYDILAKGTSSLAICMRNENIVQVLKSDDYKTKFPIYASMIECHFRKGMERKELLEQGNKIFHFLFKNFPELPYDCTETIFSYLRNEDLRTLIDGCKPLSISNPNTNINGCAQNEKAK
ncbi:ankyrin-3-like [Eurosta solidaginis]|uniref:ankyrin-3-like n=1 Tax=Eurosta solidaginis TaxID=178769 RepID=UPI003530C3B8